VTAACLTSAIETLDILQREIQFDQRRAGRIGISGKQAKLIGVDL